jgi:hypothetical protein
MEGIGLGMATRINQDFSTAPNFAAAPVDIKATLAALDEEYRSRRERVAREALMGIAERKKVHREALRSLDQEEQEIARLCGGSLPQALDPERGVFKRPPRSQDAERIAIVPVEQYRPGPPQTIEAAVRLVLSDGEKHRKKAIVDEVVAMGLYVTRESIAAHVPTINGIQSEKDTSPGAHHAARVYWIPRAA